MKRRLLKVSAAVSLALFIAVSASYARAFFWRDEIHTSICRRDCLAATFPHHVHILLANRASVAPYPTSLTRGLSQYPSVPKYLQPRFSTNGLYSAISIPFWLPQLFLTAAPLWMIGATRRRRARTSAGLCAECGYDLRASTGRCPVCGVPIPRGQLDP